MVSPSPKPPAGSNDEALDILRRIEPALARLASRDDIAKMDDRLRKVEENVARLDGRVSQPPTLWQIAGLNFAIFGAAFVLIRFAPPH
ncbi:hypothetical protein [Azospirillum halopraeferens]|uniref:hypothetical protein n=1 Tax=Azospirillum halopraeferens TaxID=34010 RepID=UPI00041BB909|nr:hypothetical protein [Azospirillum halopraeferens]